MGSMYVSTRTRDAVVYFAVECVYVLWIDCVWMVCLMKCWCALGVPPGPRVSVVLFLRWGFQVGLGCRTRWQGLKRVGRFLPMTCKRYINAAVQVTTKLRDFQVKFKSGRCQLELTATL